MKEILLFGVLPAAAVLAAVAWPLARVWWLHRKKLPPLRAEPLNFPGVPNVPVDPEERRESERDAVELEQKHVSALEHARSRRERRRRRK